MASFNRIRTFQTIRGSPNFVNRLIVSASCGMKEKKKVLPSGNKGRSFITPCPSAGKELPDSYLHYWLQQSGSDLTKLEAAA